MPICVFQCVLDNHVARMTTLFCCSLSTTSRSCFPGSPSQNDLLCCVYNYEFHCKLQVPFLPDFQLLSLKFFTVCIFFVFIECINIYISLMCTNSLISADMPLSNKQTKQNVVLK